MIAKQSVGIFIFDDVEVLDFAGPFEVFSRVRLVPGSDSRRTDDSAPFHVFTVARTKAPITGLLAGRRATTHWAAHDLLGSLDSSIAVDREARVVSDGVVTSAGVSAGIDMAFTVVERLCGRDVADETARYIDYPRHTVPTRAATGPII